MAAKVVIFGAGATGRGHVGLLAWQAGLDVVFVDQRQELVQQLAQAGGYPVEIYGPEGLKRVEVNGIRALRSADRNAAAREIVDAAMALTAVRDQNLPDVAVTIALAIRLCRESGRTAPLNVIACENTMGSSTALGALVRQSLSEEDLAYCNEYCGFPDCMVSRVVPQPEDDSLRLVTESYNEWTARWEQFRGAPPTGFSALTLVANQTACFERKFFVHNSAHAICGYMAWQRGYAYIHEAMRDPVVAQYVESALDELAEIVCRKHGFATNELEDYKNSLIQRFSSPMLKDQVARAVRDPLRKLARGERLVAPALLSVEYRTSRLWIIRGIVAALRYHTPADPQSVDLANRIAGLGLDSVLKGVCGIPDGAPLREEIVAAWEDWALPAR